MRRIASLAPVLPALILGWGQLVQSQNQEGDVFIEKPYLQLGDAPKLSSPESLVLLWHTADQDAEWSVEVQAKDDKRWAPAAPPSMRRVDAPGIPVHRIYSAELIRLSPGDEFSYRVARNKKSVFEATGHARKAANQPYRFVSFGDCAANTPSERAVAYQAFMAKPDFVFIPGDIVYSNGRIAEYRAKFFPVYNADQTSSDTGAPLMRSVPFMAAPGNHDILPRNYSLFADAMAYFLYWDQPLNGPAAEVGAVNTPVLQGNPDAQPAFLAAAQKRYPRMANFSFDYGNAHWTVLDSNPYVDWTNPARVAWIANDLAAAKSAQWRFVAFHHPGFNSSKTHFQDQWMRVLSEVFEAGGVDIVFSGHVHNYQRTFPMRFTPEKGKNGGLVGQKGLVGGVWKLDKQFDDGSKGKPNGVIYLITGAGGAGLYNTAQQADRTSWQEFTQKYIADQHSFTVVDVNGSQLKMKQISETGAELDSFQITK